MAKLSSLFSFQGSLDGISVYKMQGVNQPIVRKKGGPTKEMVQNAPAFAPTRRINKELGGRSQAAGLVMETFQPLKHLADFDTAGRLNGLLVAVQKLDLQSPWGRRSVVLSQAPWLLQGFTLAKKAPFDAVVRTPLSYTLNREELNARVELPALLPGINFAPSDAYPLYRLVATLGLVPDLYYAAPRDGYAPGQGWVKLFPAIAATGWQPVKSNANSAVLELGLAARPAGDHFSLVLSVGIEWGTMGALGNPEIVRKKGSARILAMG